MDKKKSAIHQELERRAQDLIRVYNPLSEDYVVTWDVRNGAKKFRVKAKQEGILIRYIAQKFVKEIFEKIMYDKAAKAIIDENQRRVERGMAEMDKTQKTGEQLKFESRFYNPTQEEAKKIIAVLWMGVESEFGIDTEVDATISEEYETDKPIFQSAFESVQQERTTAPVRTQDAVAPSVREKPEGSSCDFPGCGFAAKNEMGLMAHKRTHRTEDIDSKKKDAAASISQ